MSLTDIPECRIDTVSSVYKFHTIVDVLRLDLVDPVISGNKWFKLKNYLVDARKNNNIVLTFGGYYSNHIVATAAAAGKFGLKSIGIIRGEQPTILSPTLQDASGLGMQLFFSSRMNYKEKKIPDEVFNQFDRDQLFIIPEGGYGLPGMHGAMDILKTANISGYTHILAAVGTGTMLAGLVSGSIPVQKLIGIPVMKNNIALENQIKELLNFNAENKFTLLHDYHFGGYAKYSPGLLRFMNEWFITTAIPSDIVYTGKLFYAVNDLILKNFFPGGSRLLVIHSGGLQGNRSLTNGTLIF
jgi:1-aminocyclopropane-1-carboxylate deaminase